MLSLGRKNKNKHHVKVYKTRNRTEVSYDAMSKTVFLVGLFLGMAVFACLLPGGQEIRPADQSFALLALSGLLSKLFARQHHFFSLKHERKYVNVHVDIENVSLRHINM